MKTKNKILIAILAVLLLISLISYLICGDALMFYKMLILLIVLKFHELSTGRPFSM